MKVSIIVPIYNVEQYIRDCAVSVLGQTYPDIEFIFVDDASPDHSIAVLNDVIDSQFPLLRPNIQIIRKQRNEGLPQARLTGLQHATGDYVLHVDSDDTIELDAVEKLVRKARESYADLVYFYVRKTRANGRTHIARDKSYMDPRDFSRDIFLFRAHGYAVNKFARRSCYRKEFFYPKVNMHEDMVLMGQLLFHCSKVALLPEALYNYRRDNGASETRQARAVRRAASARNFLDLYESYQNRLPGSPIEPVAGRILRRCAWIALRWDHSLKSERPYLASTSGPLLSLLLRFI